MREISFFSRTTLRSAMILFLIGSLAVKRSRRGPSAHITTA